MKSLGHVLVVDDSLTVRMMLSSHLEQEGYQVTAFVDGESCVNYLEESDEWPDLVLLDLMMPGIDGIEVLNWIKLQKGHGFLPVMLLTAMGEVDDRVRGLDEGADDYIPKLFEAEELMARVRVQLRLKSLQDELSRRNQALVDASMENAIILSQLEEKNNQLSQMATTDALTNVANRGHIEECLIEEVARARRFRHPVSVAMLDLDFFKSLNDTHGHQFGDRVLRDVSKVMSDMVREVDKVGRYGGEEFILVLPDTNLEGAVIIADRIRQAISGIDFSPVEVCCTASIGVAEWHAELSSWEDLVARADAALYRAKETGRNCVCHHADEPESVGG
ncbi:MAG: diguanylate cyclase [Leptospirillia bacterium]